MNLKTKLFAILHDGTMDGDCAGDPKNMFDVTYRPDIRMDEVIDMYRAKRFKENEGEWFEEDEDELTDLKGGWIVNESTVDLMEAVADAVDPGNDSSVYSLQRALKAIARKLSIHNFGEDVK